MTVEHWHEKDFDKRFETMGDIAEAEFCRWCNNKLYKNVRFGFNRPDLDAFWWLPKMLRYIPDFVLEAPCEESYSKFKHAFVEVKGCGKDGIVKIKLDNLWALGQWEKTLPVIIFSYNNVRGVHGITTLEDVRKNYHSFERAVFGDNKKEYLCIPSSDDIWRLELE